MGCLLGQLQPQPSGVKRWNCIMNYCLFSTGIPSEAAPLWGLSLWDEYAEARWPSVVQSTWWAGQVLNWEGGERREG